MTVYVKLPPNSGHLSITDKSFKNRRCPLFRGFTFFYDFLGCPRPNLGHKQGGKLTQLFSITKLLLIWPEGHQEPRYEVASRIPARHISEIWTGNLLVLRLTRYPIVLIWRLAMYNLTWFKLKSMIIENELLLLFLIEIHTDLQRIYTAKNQGNSSNDFIFSSIFSNSIRFWHWFIFENIQN